jgi:uncharacterized protein with PIN domain
MPITITCFCGKKLRAPVELAGTRAKCPACGQMLLVPAPPEALTSGSASSPEVVPVAGLAAPAVPAPPGYEGRRLPEWLDLLAGGDQVQRRKAAEVLAGVGPEAAVEIPEIVERLSSDHILVRHWSVVVLGRMGAAAQGAFEQLITRLQDDQPLIREKAMEAIGQVSPQASAFFPALRRGLSDAAAQARDAAVARFRLDLNTAGISRFRFWSCSCGRVYVKDDLEERLRQLAHAPAEANWQGMLRCKHCQAAFPLYDVYAGKHDVPEKYWPKLKAKFGDRLSLPDDFLGETREAADDGYRLSDDGGSRAVFDDLPALAAFSSPLAPEAFDDDHAGYSIAASAPPLAVAPQAAAAVNETGDGGEEEADELTPGATVPKTGKYRCTACTKSRMRQMGAATPRASVVRAFKAGKKFSECPQCGEFTEWQWLGE